MLLLVGLAFFLCFNESNSFGCDVFGVDPKETLSLSLRADSRLRNANRKLAFLKREFIFVSLWDNFTKRVVAGTLRLQK